MLTTHFCFVDIEQQHRKIKHWPPVSSGRDVSTFSHVKAAGVAVKDDGGQTKTENVISEIYLKIYVD